AESRFLEPILRPDSGRTAAADIAVQFAPAILRGAASSWMRKGRSQLKHSTLPAVLLTSLMFVGLALAQDGPESVLRGTKQFRKSVLVSGLAGPWELTWGPDNMLWVTERTGKRVTRIDPFTGERSIAITIDEVSAPGSQDGLLGMALHPELLKGNNYVYVAYT